jgi:hypothetical protein
LYGEQDRLTDAIPLLQQAVAIVEQLARPEVEDYRHTLAMMEQEQARRSETQPRRRRITRFATQIREQSRRLLTTFLEAWFKARNSP